MRLAFVFRYAHDLLRLLAETACKKTKKNEVYVCKEGRGLHEMGDEKSV